MERESTQNYGDFCNIDADCIVIDRREDPITPLVMNWSYYALVDEILSISDNSIQIPEKQGKQIFCRSMGDSFLEKYWDKNYGEVSKGISEIMEEQIKSKRTGKLKNASLEEMKEIMMNIPEQKRAFNDLLKHSDAISYISEVVKKRNLFAISEL